MKRIISIILCCGMLCLGATLAGCNAENISGADTTNATQTTNPPTQATEIQTETQPATEAVFDITSAYANKPYTNAFALEMVDKLQYLSNDTLYQLCSIDESPIFYEDFFYENNAFNVTLDTYSYDMDNETVRKYFDTYEYSKFASMGALRVVDSFVYDDEASNKLLYYCYYTLTHWSESEELDTMDYYRDVITVDKSNGAISIKEKIAIATELKIPKEITGEHDFHNVI